MKAYKKLFESGESHYRGVKLMTLSEIETRVRQLIEEQLKEKLVGYDEDGNEYTYNDRLAKLWENTLNKLKGMNFYPDHKFYFTEDFPDTHKDFRVPLEKYYESQKRAFIQNGGMLRSNRYNIFICFFPEWNLPDGYVSSGPDSRLALCSRDPAGLYEDFY